MSNLNQSVQMPNLPLGGGAVAGLPVEGNVGPTGMAITDVKLPLLVSTPGTLLPAVSLSYSSSSGNGEFGLGWNVPILSIRRQTGRGYPNYDNSDVFLDPFRGVPMEAERDVKGEIITQKYNAIGNFALGGAYTVVRYLPIHVEDNSRIEYWESKEAKHAFWVVHNENGGKYLFGYNPSGRISESAEGIEKVLVWNIEEEMNTEGKHVVYEYIADDEVGLQEGQRKLSNQKYLAKIVYDNLIAAENLIKLNSRAIDDKEWHCHIVFDYAGKGASFDDAPAFGTANKDWSVRPDPVLNCAGGFEIWSYRRCHQVLAYKYFAGNCPKTGSTPELISRLVLEYKEHIGVTLLRAIHRIHYDESLTASYSPIIELGYTEYSPQPKFVESNILPKDSTSVKFLDIMGDGGIPSILISAGSKLQCRRPIRGDETSPVKYSSLIELASPPSPDAKFSFIDIDGDGKLEVVYTHGLSGYVSKMENGKWGETKAFTNELPAEFNEALGNFVNLTGKGMSDLIFLKGNRVEFYRSLGLQGFEAKPIVVNYSDSEGGKLPEVNPNQTKQMVVFADVLGSGHQHLVEITYKAIKCWPNLGNGKFGPPMMLGRNIFNSFVSEQDFDVRKVVLADVTGSGLADIIYAKPESGLYICENMTGMEINRQPKIYRWPDGISIVNTESYQVADIYGTGGQAVIVSQTIAGRVSHFVLDLIKEERPLLLKSVENGMGLQTVFTYRSSGQEWLDEKQDITSSSMLPFTMNLVKVISVTDEVRGNVFTKNFSYRKGVFDPVERQFCGFALVEHRDTDADWVYSQDNTAPLLIKQWFHVGLDPKIHASDFFAGDKYALPLENTLNSIWKENSGDEEITELEENEARQFRLALRGRPMRTETYALDQSILATVPAAVSMSRYMVRKIQSAATRNSSETKFVLMPLELEAMSFEYARNLSDPVCSHDLNMEFDSRGFITRSISITYPRRDDAQSLPNFVKNYFAGQDLSAWEGSHFAGELDKLTLYWERSKVNSQKILRLVEKKQSFHHVISNGENWLNWRIGLPDEGRVDEHELDEYKPSARLSIQSAIKLLGDENSLKRSQLIDLSRVNYWGEASELVKGLAQYSEHAELSEAILKAAYSDQLEPAEYNSETLGALGFKVGKFKLQNTARDGEVIYARKGFENKYGIPNLALGFTRLTASSSNGLDSWTKFEYDEYAGFVVGTKDEFGNEKRMLYDYRQGQPSKIVDENAVAGEVAFGDGHQVIATTEYKEGQDATKSFASLAEFQKKRALSCEENISNPYNFLQGAHSVVIHYHHDWFGVVSADQLKALDGSALKAAIDNLWVTSDGRVRSAGAKLSKAPADTLSEDARKCNEVFKNAPHSIPVHSLLISARGYPSEKISPKVSVHYLDGVGRKLQDRMLEDVQGDKYVWNVYGHDSLNNKAEVIHQYRTFRADTYKYAAPPQSHLIIRHRSTALGDAKSTIDAAGRQTRIRNFLWFELHDDANDLSELELFPE